MREHRALIAGSVFILLLIGAYVATMMNTIDTDFARAVFTFSSHHEISDDEPATTAKADGEEVSEDAFKRMRNHDHASSSDAAATVPEFCQAPLRFLSAGDAQTLRHPVALASFPGSGNTWLRFLIEQGSRTYTGSVYEDAAFHDAFQGEGSKNASTVCVKTHFPCPKCWTYQTCSWCAGAKPVTAGMTGPVYTADYNIYLLRSPFDSFLAEFYRIKSGDHSGKLPVSAFTSVPKKKSYETEYDKPTWNQFIGQRLPAYIASVKFYLGKQEDEDGERDGDVFRDESGKRLTKRVFYEELKSAPERELTSLFAFVKRIYASEQRQSTFPHTSLDYAQCSLHHNAREKFSFHRNKTAVFNPWTKKQVDRVCAALGTKYWFSDVWGECRDGLLQVQRNTSTAALLL